MKKFFVFFASLLCASFMALGQEETGPSIIIKKGNPPIVSPRTLIPLSAYYNIGGVDLLFTEDLGVVAVTVVNQTTGEQWFDLADTALGAVRVDTSTPEPAGAYLINLELEDGTYYWGEFWVY